MKLVSKLLLCGMCAGLSQFAAGQTSAPAQQSYPNKPIRLIVPSSPGGPLDLIARMLTPRWGELLGQQIVIDNRAGAGGGIGNELVAKGAPDGYTLLLGGLQLVIGPQLRDYTPYDTLKDFAPVSLAVSAPFVLVVHPHVPAKSVKELIALAKAQPGKLNYSSGGAGAPLHLLGELFNLAAGVQIMHVPYKGSGPGMTALMAAEVDMMFNSLSTVLPYVKTDKLRALAVAGEKRSVLLPHVPTVRESGFQVNTIGWYGVLAPRHTPQTIVAKLHGTLVRVLNSPQIEERLTGLGIEVTGSTPEAFASLLREEMVTWGKVINAAGLKEK